MNKYGPNMTKLIIQFMGKEAIPSGGGIADGIKFFTDPEHRKLVMDKAELEAVKAIALIQSAPDNPYGNDQEKIAGALVQAVLERKAKQKLH